MAFLVMTVAFGAKRPRTALAAAGVSFLLLLGERDAVWFVDRAWAMMAAGWFAFLSLRFPGWTLTARAAAAVVAAATTVAAAVLASPASWTAFEGVVADRAAATLEAITFELRRSGGMDPTLAARLDMVFQAQVLVFPALAGLATSAALAAAWWGYGKLSGGGAELQPLATFNFNDHWVWIFVVGLGLLVVGGINPPSRLALNLLVFAGGFFALRGLAVVSYLGRRRRRIVYGVLAVLGALAWPGILSAALILGIADVWLDARSHQPEEAT